MRFASLTALLVLAAGSAAAQNDQSEIVIPPAPVIVAAPAAAPAPVAPAAQLPAPPPGLVQTPLPPVTQSPLPQPATDNADAPPAATQAAGQPAVQAAQMPTQPAMPDVAPVPPNDWVPGHTAMLGLLNKVDGSTSQLSIPVGAQNTVGDLQVSVLACATRPPAQISDDAVFLAVQPADGSAQVPLYRGWMVRSAPGATVVGDAGETFRVIGCS